MEEWTPDWLVEKFSDPDLANDILVGINDVPWQEINHAYGPANDVPALLYALCSDVYEHGDFALELLFGNIWHQGTVYEATRFVTPYLIQILLADSVFLKHRISILHLLDSMANGSSYFDSHYDLNPEWSEKYFEEKGTTKEETLARELRDVRLARESVQEQKDALLSLTKHKEDEFACSSYMLLGGFRELSSELFPQFVNGYTVEHSHEKRLAILEALSNLAMTSEEHISFFRRIMQDETNLEIRAIAALAMLKLQKQSYEKQVLEALLKFTRSLAENEKRSREVRSWEYVHYSTTGIYSIGHELISLSTTTKLREFVAFISIIKRPNTVFDMIHELFFHLFRNDTHHDIFSLHSRKDGKVVRQYCRRGLVEVTISEPVNLIDKNFVPAITMLLKLPQFWEIESNFLNVFGLPHSQSELQRLIQIHT